MSGLVLSLCDRTTTILRPWRDAGFDCMAVDIQHPRGESTAGDGVVLVGADVRRWLPPRRDYAAVFAFPPCTHLAVSGARWFRDKGLGALAEALELVEACRRICEWSGAPWMLENPVSTLSTYWRKPDAVVHPWHFAAHLDDPEAENTTKATCLWTGGGFVLPEPAPVAGPHRNDVHRMPPSADRADRRSQTPAGFSRAVFLANGGGRVAPSLFGEVA